MQADLTAPAARLRNAITRVTTRFGFREDSFLLVLAVVIGFLSAVAAVGFHELILFVRDSLYLRAGEQWLYHQGLYLLVLFPALGGLAVGMISKYLFRTREGHGIVDVMESVVKSSGFEKPLTGIEKILTAGMTIGTGGSTGAEGPIVQIGAAIASGVGQLFRISRAQMPVLIGCGSAAGISAIFNAPFGGVLFTLEVILQDFSIRAFTPVVVASVIAQVSELLMFKLLHHSEEFHAIFNVPRDVVDTHGALQWGQVPNFVVLGIICGVVGLALTRAMFATEHFFAKAKIPKEYKPAVGGVLLGLLGMLYIAVFGHWLLHEAKPVPFDQYPMPAFFGDGYGFIEQLLTPKYLAYGPGAGKILILLACLCGIKILATCLTLGSGGSGGVIAPSLFLGATVGAVLGAILNRTGWFPDIHPEMYALVGMGAALAAVVHAPLASILICFEVTEDYRVMVPAMLACIIATGIARVIYHDSIYTSELRKRGIRLGGPADVTLLRRMNVEQVTLEPATIVRISDPLQKILDISANNGTGSFVVVGDDGEYRGMVVSDDLQTALFQRDAIPLLVAGDVSRPEVPVVHNTDDLGAVLDTFSQFDVSHLPVSVSSRPNHVIGLISRTGLMRRYQRGLAETA
jgi:CIC family chloride channel protein